MSPEEMAESMIQNFTEKTGHPLEHWIQIAAKSGHAKHGQLVNMLKTEHGMTHGFANLVAHKFLKSDAGSASPETDLVDEQYASGKEHLRPIYDAIIKKVKGFGKDVEIAPKRAYVALRRNKQFGLIQPSTKTRVDVGINIKGKDPVGKLEASGSWNTMVSHRIKLSDVSEVDEQLIKWLKEAYESA